MTAADDYPPPFPSPGVKHLAPLRPGSVPAVGTDPYGDDSRHALHLADPGPDARVRVLTDDGWTTVPRSAPTATVKLPGSFCDWLAAILATLGPAPTLDDVRTTLDGARRTERRRGYFLTLDATAPVLDMLAALAADCVNLGRPATGHNTREAARTARLRLAHARTTLEQP